jgi:cysteine desulfurase
VVFTSGRAKADNRAIFGTMTKPGGHIITSSIEHHAVLRATQVLEKKGCQATYLRVDASGRVDPGDVRRPLRPNTRLITIMLANNETGVLLPVEEIGRIARKYGVLIHTDAVQAAGRVSIDVEQIGCDLLSISGHKMHGPQGTGALFVRRGVKLEPMFHGGVHERGLRAGTENVAGIAGLGEAAMIARHGLRNGGLKKLTRLRDALERSILLEVGNADVNAGRVDRVPNTTNIRFDGVDGRLLLTTLDAKGLSVSGGSACGISMCEPSHVLLAMGLTPERANRSVRFSLSKQTTAEDVDFAIWQVAEVVAQLRSNRNTKPAGVKRVKKPSRVVVRERI